MAFRKRSVGLSRTSAADPDPTSTTPSAEVNRSIPGIRASPVDGRPTTSTGTSSLDGILAGHAGLALGSSLLIEESGTTDYGGALLRYYAAEGVVQGHQIHLLGVGESWTRELPGLVGSADDREGSSKATGSKEKMKIAWRYERLGEFGAGAGVAARSRAPPTSEQDLGRASTATAAEPAVFCHVFDLAKRLEIPAGTSFDYLPIDNSPENHSPFAKALQALSTRLSSSAPDSVHRLIVPTILSPALYPPHANLPQHVLSFFQSLRTLLRQYPHKLTALVTLPLELHSRESGVVRWMELLSDGVLELTPFPHTNNVLPPLSTSGAATAQEDPPQGMVKVHALPVFHERGGGGGVLKDLGDDLAFTMSRRKFVIKPYSLPPAEGDTEAQQGSASAASGQIKKDQIEF